MSLIFKTNTGSLVDIGVLILRIGISFGFIWAGIGKVSDPAGFGMMLQNMVGIQSEMATNMAMLIGSLELISGILILLGLLTRPSALFQIFVLIGAMVMFGFDFTAGPAIWKDPSMLGLAIMLVLFGSGKIGVDNIIAKRFNSSYKYK
ncbi:MAG: DoxX family protein [Nitrosarchaeum sp.]|nr:DoxX family protein [Nitrosarchaeum sp.]